MYACYQLSLKKYNYFVAFFYQIDAYNGIYNYSGIYNPIVYKP